MRRQFSVFNLKFKKRVAQAGFSLVELLLSMTVFSILVGIVTLNLHTAQNNTSITSTVDTLLADLSQQQIKAMVGDTEGRSVLSNYGILIGTGVYKLFFGTYSATESSNFSINLSTSQQITTTFPSNQILFLKGSGEISGFIAGQNTITVKSTVSNDQKIIQINRYGVVMGIN